MEKVINKWTLLFDTPPKGVMVELIKEDENDILMEEIEQEDLTRPELKLEEIDEELL